MGLNLEPLKEPRGFIRIVQIFLAILAFSTTASYDGSARIKVVCNPPSANATTQFGDVCFWDYEFSYPFNTNRELHFTCAKCMQPDSRNPVNFTVISDRSSSAEFFVTTGVLSFLYGLAAIVVYVMLTEGYESTAILPFVDLIGTGILAFFWFISWCVWVAQSGNVKDDFLGVPGQVCTEMMKSGSPGYTFSCSNEKGVSFTKLTVSLVFGFGNIILWAGSTWFVYKETHFHRSRERRSEYDGAVGGPRGMAAQQQLP